METLQTTEMMLNMGPSHPAMHGIIRLILKLRGETIEDAEVEIGYLHRAFEKMAEQDSYTSVIPYTDRLNYVSPLINNFGYCLAVEKLFGVDVPERCKYIRVIMSELSRIADHMTCIGANAMELGAMTVFLYLIKAREFIWELVEDVCGARVTISYSRIGGLKEDLPEGFFGKTKTNLKKVKEVLKEVDLLLTRNKIFYDRMKGVGIISKDDAVSYGITGPFLRSTGINYDVRKAQPYLIYDLLDFDIPLGENGDNFDRYVVRMEEMQQSMRIIEQALKDIPEGEISVSNRDVILPPKNEVYTNIEALMAHFKLIMDDHGIRSPAGEVYFPVEGANGELGFYVVSDGTGKPYRVRVRPPCFQIMAALPEILKGEMIADIVPTFGSVNMIGGELDR